MSNNSSNKSPLFHSVIAGGSAGISELLIMYPLDVIKTRYQATTSTSSTRLMTALMSALKQDGFGIYRGILFPILTEAPKRAVKFTANSAFSDIIKKNKIAEGNLAAVMSGAGTGMSEGLLVVAPELIKIRMQLPENRALYKSSVDAARAIVRAEGVNALFVGTCATLLRNGAWNTCYFGSIAYIRKALGTPKSQGEKVRNDLIAGTISGTLGTVFNTPFDVIKTRIQNASARPSAQPIPMKVLPLGMHIVRTEGVKALWKGFIPKVVRLGPGGGIMLFVYDQVSAWLSKD
jgi:solute carrier family 25 2-oxodicarboxylate transporter 21